MKRQSQDSPQVVSHSENLLYPPHRCLCEFLRGVSGILYITHSAVLARSHRYQQAQGRSGQV
jgi:hypothetical protein